MRRICFRLQVEFQYACIMLWLSTSQILYFSASPSLSRSDCTRHSLRSDERGRFLALCNPSMTKRKNLQLRRKCENIEETRTQTTNYDTEPIHALSLSKCDSTPPRNEHQCRYREQTKSYTIVHASGLPITPSSTAIAFKPPRRD